MTTADKDFEKEFAAEQKRHERVHPVRNIGNLHTRGGTSHAYIPPGGVGLATEAELPNASLVPISVPDWDQKSFRDGDTPKRKKSKATSDE